ncbi:MAG: GNAT family N-acetyltransferase [Spirochaetaceae bacterium]|nr:GNAT family N-acetyltransferase [Spirochaetaceae bacterium]
MNKLEVIRAEEEWQRAGAYSVRIQGMNKQHHIPLRDEFDEHDGNGTKYIVILDDGYPIATCRFYEISPDSVSLGRVVVLPEYRGKNIGRMAVEQAEIWIRECGYKKIEIDSRTVAVKFYEKLGFFIVDDKIISGGTFDCIKMKKVL